MNWNTVFRLGLLLACWLALARGQAEGPEQTTPSFSDSATSAPSETHEAAGGMTSDQRAALWAGFVGGMVCIFGMGMLFYDMVVRKYTLQYQMQNSVDMHVANYKP